MVELGHEEATEAWVRRRQHRGHGLPAERPKYGHPISRTERAEDVHDRRRC
jgi:hypothetical protein